MHPLVGCFFVGWDDVLDDPSMGWGRYAHTMRVMVLTSGLFYIKPSPRTVQLMDRVTERLSKEQAWDQVNQQCNTLIITMFTSFAGIFAVYKLKPAESSSPSHF